MVLNFLNLVFSIFVWLIIEMIARRENPKFFGIAQIVVFAILTILSLPLIFGYKYSNWILEYFSVPFFLTSIALLICLSLRTWTKIRKSLWLFIIAFAFNLIFQGLSFFGRSFAGAGYPSKYEPNPDWIIDGYYITEFWSQGFSGPQYKQYVLEKPILNGFLYKEIDRVTDLEPTACEITFHVGNSDSLVFDRCKKTLRK